MPKGVTNGVQGNNSSSGENYSLPKSDSEKMLEVHSLAIQPSQTPQLRSSLPQGVVPKLHMS